MNSKLNCFTFFRCIIYTNSECLSAYHARNGKFPSRIVFYRSTDWIAGDDTFHVVRYSKWAKDEMEFRHYELDKVKVILSTLWLLTLSRVLIHPYSKCIFSVQ